jgi:DNA-binding CsgD family transcriptional regulator
MIRSFLHQSTSKSFLRFFAIVLIAEVITIFVAWLLLDMNTKKWVQDKAEQAMRISQQAASSADWSLVGKIPNDRDTALGTAYGKRLSALDDRYFPHLEGGVYLVTLQNGEEFDLSSDDTQMSEATDANKWEIEAYSRRRAIYSKTPIADEWATYLAAYVPILRNGKVQGLLATEIDSAPLSDFESVVRTTFLFSIIPAILASLVVAYFLASSYVEPMAVFRTIAETTESQRDLAAKGGTSDTWTLLTARQRQVADLVSQGKSYREIAEALSVSSETVKQHLKDIKARTGWGRVELAINAAARSTPRAPRAAT